MDKTKRRRQRLAAQTGSPADQATHLRALILSGEFTEQEVALAAHLRNKPAMLLMGIDPYQPIEMHLWAGEMAKFGKDVLVRAGEAMGIKVLGTATDVCSRRWARDLRRIVDCASAWIRAGGCERQERMAAAVMREIQVDQIDLTMLDHSCSSANLSVEIILDLASLMRAKHEVMGAPVSVEELCESKPRRRDTWQVFAYMCFRLAWMADGSANWRTMFTAQPCCAATLHTIGFLRNRLLTDERWRRL